QALVVLGNVLQAIFTELRLNSDELIEFQSLLEKIDNPEVLRPTLSVQRALLLDGWGQLDPRYGAPPPIMSAGHGLLAAVGTYDQVLSETLQAYDAALRFTSTSRREMLNQPFLYVRMPSFAPMFNLWANPMQTDLASIVYDDALISARLELLRT